MDPKEARKIARHHLGDALMSVYRGGPYADQWTVQIGATTVGIPGGLFTAATVEEAAQAAAAQLRAGGWVPTHARLVWYAGEEGFTLSLCIDQLVQVLWMWLPADGLDRATKIRSIQTWCAATLPSLHLPPFPGASDA